MIHLIPAFNLLRHWIAQYIFPFLPLWSLFRKQKTQILIGFSARQKENYNDNQASSKSLNINLKFINHFSTTPSFVNWNQYKQRKFSDRIAQYLSPSIQGLLGALVLRGAFERPAGVLVCDVWKVESAGPWARCTGVAHLNWENGVISQRVTCPDADS